MKKKRKHNIKRLLGIMLAAIGIVIAAVPFYFRYLGQKQTEKLLSGFEQEVTQTAEVEKTGGKSGDSLLDGEGVIGIIEIPKLSIRYPVLEGAGTEQMAKGIGHMSETAGIGETGNCVLCGHNGARSSVYFTYLSTLTKGDVVKVTDKKGMVHVYQVADTYVTNPYDSRVTKQGDTEELTLFTCAEHGTRRFICKCVPEDTQETKKEGKG
jgi:sortase A